MSAATVVKLTLTHSPSEMVVMEKRYTLGQTIASIKANCATHFPTPADRMKLKLLDDMGRLVEGDMNDDKQLGYYQCRDGFTIAVVDLEPDVPLPFETDVSKVEKFEISDEAYAKRTDNARAFRERCIAQQKAAQGADPSAPSQKETYEAAAANIKVGNRCKVTPGDRIGTVRYVGLIPQIKEGYWVGVEYDEPVGKNDGTAGKGPSAKRYFECKPLYGGYTRPDQVAVGDFPPESFD